MDGKANFPASQTTTTDSLAPEVPRGYLTYEELSQQTGISVSTLRRRVSDGTIPFFQPGGPRTRIVFPLDAVERLIQPASLLSPPKPESIQPKQHRLGPRPKWQRDAQT